MIAKNKYFSNTTKHFVVIHCLIFFVSFNCIRFLTSLILSVGFILPWSNDETLLEKRFVIYLRRKGLTVNTCIV